MSKLYHALCVSLFALSATALSADGPAADFQSQENPFIDLSFTPPDLSPHAAVASAPSPAPVAEAPFSPFTGKIKGRKVRLRHQADLDGYVVKELNKNDFVSVVGRKGDFWAVEPPAGTKAYVFRAFVLDNVVEGNRVNIRLSPSTEAPSIGHFNSGDRVEGIISAVNNKWLEITLPKTTQFYVAKDLVEYAGPPELKKQFDSRSAALEQLLDTTTSFSSTELKKSFEAIDFEKACRGYQTIIAEYSDFPEHVEQAKEALASLQEAYLQKRIAHLEEQAQAEALAIQTARTAAEEQARSLHEISAKMRSWEPVEEALYSNWMRLAENQSQQQYYDEQKLTAVAIRGIVEPYNTGVKNKPGDFIIKNKNDGAPVGYLYSTTINLQNLVGKEISLLASPRANNNFAFPAYFVLDVESTR